MTQAYRAHRRDAKSVSPAALIGRCLGVLAWRLADPATLPVEEIARRLPARHAAERAGSPRAGLVYGGFALLVLLGAVCLAVGLSAHARIGRVAASFLHDPGRSTLEETARSVEQAVAGAWWRPLYPSFPGRLARAAEAIRAGRAPLVQMVDAYEEARAALDGMSLPARLLHGAGVVEPVVEAAASVPTEWHRRLDAYDFMRQAIEPYAKPNREIPAALGGRIFVAPPHQALMATIYSREGRVYQRIPSRLEVGDGFQIPLLLGGRLVLNRLFRHGDGGIYEVAAGESLSVPIEEIEDGAFVFPKSGASFSFSYDKELKDLAPRLPSPGASVREELDLEPAGDP